MNTANFVGVLAGEAEALIARIEADPRASRLFEGTVTAEEYAGFLEQTYHYVRWTKPLCARAGRRLAAAGGGPIAELLLRKAAEEDGHERWALADLAALGRAPEPALLAAPSLATRAYISWSRFTAEGGAAEAFLGTAYVLEVLSVRRAGRCADNLVARSGIPGIEGATRFLRGHAGADEGHVAELQAWLAAVTDEEAREAIALSARMTRTLYPRLLAGALRRGRRGAREAREGLAEARETIAEAAAEARHTVPPVSGVIRRVNAPAPRGSTAPPGSAPRARRTRAAGAS